MNFINLNFAEQLSERDYESIKNNTFFIKFPNEFQIFTQIKNQIATRIKNLVIVCESFF